MSASRSLQEFTRVEVQRPVGIAVGAIGIIVAAVYFAELVTNDGYNVIEALTRLQVWFVFLLSAVMAASAWLKGAAARGAQVLVFYVVGLLSALDSETGNLTSLLFILLAMGFAVQYRLVQERYFAKTLPFAGIYLAALGAGVAQSSGQSLLIALHTVLGAVAVGLIYHIFLKAVRREQLDRELELSEVVQERTWQLQQQLSHSHRLRSELNDAVADKDKLLKHKDTLLRELHHRTKNNMQLVSSLLSIENTNVTDQHTRQAVMNSKSRINALALVHEHLYKSGDVAEVELGTYADHLLRDLWRRLAPPEIDLRSEFAEGIRVDIDFAIPFGLIINELVFNAIEHAFPDGAEGRVSVILSNVKNGIDLEVSDNGAGMPQKVDSDAPKSTGLQIVTGLISQCGGEYSIDVDKGTRWQVSVPHSALSRSPRI